MPTVLPRAERIRMLFDGNELDGCSRWRSEERGLVGLEFIGDPLDPSRSILATFDFLWGYEIEAAGVTFRRGEGNVEGSPDEDLNRFLFAGAPDCNFLLVPDPLLGTVWTAGFETFDKEFEVSPGVFETRKCGSFAFNRGCDICAFQPSDSSPMGDPTAQPRPPQMLTVQFVNMPDCVFDRTRNHPAAQNIPANIRDDMIERIRDYHGNDRRDNYPPATAQPRPPGVTALGWKFCIQTTASTEEFNYYQVQHNTSMRPDVWTMPQNLQGWDIETALVDFHEPIDGSMDMIIQCGCFGDIWEFGGGNTGQCPNVASVVPPALRHALHRAEFGPFDDINETAGGQRIPHAIFNSSATAWMRDAEGRSILPALVDNKLGHQNVFALATIGPDNLPEAGADCGWPTTEDAMGHMKISLPFGTRCEACAMPVLHFTMAGIKSPCNLGNTHIDKKIFPIPTRTLWQVEEDPPHPEFLNYCLRWGKGRGTTDIGDPNGDPDTPELGSVLVEYNWRSSFLKVLAPWYDPIYFQQAPPGTFFPWAFQASRTIELDEFFEFGAVLYNGMISDYDHFTSGLFGPNGQTGGTCGGGIIPPYGPPFPPPLSGVPGGFIKVAPLGISLPELSSWAPPA